MMTKDSAPKEFKYLFDTPIYRKCNRGAGFYKFRIMYILGLSVESLKIGLSNYITLKVQGKHWRNKSSDTAEFVRGRIKNTEIVFSQENWFTNLTEYYLKNSEGSKQFLYERKHYKRSRPEYFL